MKKGVVFTIDAIYALGIAFVAVAAIIAFMFTSTAPDYSFVDSMKVIHDMAEDDTGKTPTGYWAGGNCTEKHNVSYYAPGVGYDYGGTGNNGVCAL